MRNRECIGHPLPDALIGRAVASGYRVEIRARLGYRLRGRNSRQPRLGNRLPMASCSTNGASLMDSSRGVGDRHHGYVCNGSRALSRSADHRNLPHCAGHSWCSLNFLFEKFGRKRDCAGVRSELFCYRNISRCVRKFKVQGTVGQIRKRPRGVMPMAIRWVKAGQLVADIAYFNSPSTRPSYALRPLVIGDQLAPEVCAAVQSSGS
jgi:hypothetical protein